jgi:hypothetical protein
MSEIFLTFHFIYSYDYRPPGNKLMPTAPRFVGGITKSDKETPVGVKMGSLIKPDLKCQREA